MDRGGGGARRARAGDVVNRPPLTLVGFRKRHRHAAVADLLALALGVWGAVGLALWFVVVVIHAH